MSSVTMARDNERERDQVTITPSSRVPLGVLWAILGVMVPGVFLAGISYQKMGAAEELGKQNSNEIRDFRTEVKAEFKAMSDRMQALEMLIQKQK